MGAIDGEQMVKWEKMHGVSGCEEKILVLVRLRPLSDKEIAVNEVADWECINDTTILYRNTLREGSTFPSAYTFDRVFQGDCSTKQVYEEGAKEIALSVVSGINSSIFAYGQTSSGKTYTMNGITEYSVADIFDYINRHEERAFVLKFSAIEIYNEVVRDLLSTDNTALRLRDDPERGTIVEKLAEETLRDWAHLKELLSFCEAQRQVGETYLNEKSSRSHQIIRLTVESSAREFLGKGNSTTLAASVNFVDLAGSERASQALSAGARLKEGCHINRSLLTLGTVIRKLSNGRQGHINYRDSKLTRILQPCLGGNARTAIICTLSAARSHVEQTRNTLLFACCAKEVTIKAQVNVVMSDKALVKHLQKEVARLESELRTPAHAASNCDYAALLRKKDLQIEKMEKEIRELTKQRDLAQSRVEDLLQMVGNDHKSTKEADDAWEDDCSVSESSSIYGPRQDLRHREFNNPHFNDGYNGSKPEEYPDEYCKEVQCIDSSRSDNGILALPMFGEGNTGQEMMSPLHEESETSQIQNNSADGAQEQRSNNVQMTIGSSNSRNVTLTRSWSCTEHLMSGSPERSGETESTPANGFARGFLGRPERLRGKFPPLIYGDATRLSRNDSQSSIGTPSRDELRVNSMRISADEDITSVQTFVAGMKEMVKLEYGKQLVNGQIQKNVKDVGINPMLEAPGTPLDWPLQFKRQQKEILELWQACSVSLIHRTYFFLLFRGDPTDSIYVEVELRRLSFLKETFSHENKNVKDGQIVTLSSSEKALRREREMLIKFMQRRLSEEEKRSLFKKWGIGLDSKRRRMQLANRLWSNTDMNHIIESASVIAKLVRFSEQGKAFKEMFGLSFSTLYQTRRRSYPWKNSSASLL
ncbi:kinesin-like protein KIN-7E isoform X2 [Prosopis cineraria]|uniref:kinesin-like protein KIN-7E isoform X2 n=1 Tax=Prosopis cineraria TaxID=364024 RepID=UPI00241036DD|nr:kinesin-like protein KIN-7E isoform X2 [Prosopis cineraria]